ncbi:lipopolysaccharide transport periplasmic protein LptA [Tolypothrix campylonemoides VB511288]|nr:lipopolysaccharide transport periplasmic protein LptA [Tolypothrix campylonemoides VB511288]
MTRPPASLIALLLLAAAGSAGARSSDRNQPMDVDAASSDCNIGNDAAPCLLRGDVRIVQGTLKINAATADLKRAGGDIQRVLLTGGPVRMEQQLDSGELVRANSSTVDYSLRTDTVVFTGNATLSKPDGSVSGERIVYNMATGQIQAGGNGTSERVKLRFLPKNGAGAKGGG